MAVPTPKDVFAKKTKPVKDEAIDAFLDDALLNRLHSQVTIESKKAPRAEKKPFVRKPHLTDRSLKNNPELLALKAQIAPKTK